MSDDTEKLLPCPFCGGEPKNTEYFGNYYRPDWAVHCATCDLSLDGDSTPEAAARRWNTRTKRADAMSDETEALRQIISDEWGSHICCYDDTGYPRNCDPPTRCRCNDIAKAILNTYTVTVRPRPPAEG